MDELLLKTILPYIVSNLPAAVVVGVLWLIRYELNSKFATLLAVVKAQKERLRRLTEIHVKKHPEDGLEIYKDEKEDNK